MAQDAQPPAVPPPSPMERLATALERIADLLAFQATNPPPVAAVQPPPPPPPPAQPVPPADAVTMHQITCSACGRIDAVRFAPRPDRPVLCGACYKAGAKT